MPQAEIYETLAVAFGVMARVENAHPEESGPLSDAMPDVIEEELTKLGKRSTDYIVTAEILNTSKRMIVLAYGSSSRHPVGLLSYEDSADEEPQGDHHD